MRKKRKLHIFTLAQMPWKYIHLAREKEKIAWNNEHGPTEPMEKNKARPYKINFGKIGTNEEEISKYFLLFFPYCCSFDAKTYRWQAGRQEKSNINKSYPWVYAINADIYAVFQARRECVYSRSVVLWKFAPTMKIIQTFCVDHIYFYSRVICVSATFPSLTETH